MMPYPKCEATRWIGGMQPSSQRRTRVLGCGSPLQRAVNANGAVDESLQREMIAAAARRLKPPPAVPPERVFDFTPALKAAEAFR